MKTWMFLLLILAPASYAECVLEAPALMKYEQDILSAAEKHDYKKMAQGLSCILKMQSESEGMARLFANSFLRPMMGGKQIQHDAIKKDPRYLIVAKALEDLMLRQPSAIQESFISEFSRGDWRFYTLFCEQGDTEYCSRFLPEKEMVKAQSPLIAAASMLRLRKAFTVLKGEQKEQVAQRLKDLYRDIPASDRLKRKFIEEIHRELFPIQLGMEIT